MLFTGKKKIPEQCIKQLFCGYFIKNVVDTWNEFEFSRNISCQIIYILFYDKIIGYVNQGDVIVTLYLDFSKTFTESVDVIWK